MTPDAHQTLASSVDLQSLARQIAVRMDPDCLLDAGDVAALLKCSSRYVLEEYSKALGFPKPLRLTGPGQRRAQPRWRRQDIIDWINAHADGRSKRGGRPRNTHMV